jgi:hypothetical protein
MFMYFLLIQTTLSGRFAGNVTFSSHENIGWEQGVVVHACNPSTWEVKAV